MWSLVSCFLIANFFCLLSCHLPPTKSWFMQTCPVDVTFLTFLWLKLNYPEELVLTALLASHLLLPPRIIPVNIHHSFQIRLWIPLVASPPSTAPHKTAPKWNRHSFPFGPLDSSHCSNIIIKPFCFERKSLCIKQEPSKGFKHHANVILYNMYYVLIYSCYCAFISTTFQFLFSPCYFVQADYQSQLDPKSLRYFLHLDWC